MKSIVLIFLASFAFATVLGQGFPTHLEKNLSTNVVEIDVVRLPAKGKCPPGEHSVLYCPQRAEPSCHNPTLHGVTFGPCDIPQCFCNTPNIRNTKTNKCVPITEC